MAIELNAKLDPHPDPNHPERSGAVFTGTLTYTMEYCILGGSTETKDSDPVNVTSGGFLAGNKHLLQGVTNDTVVPGGDYHLSLNPDGDIMGFDFIPQPPHRYAIELHDRQRAKGSSGCIAFTDAAGERGPWDTFYDLMLKNKGSSEKSVGELRLR